MRLAWVMPMAMTPRDSVGRVRACSRTSATTRSTSAAVDSIDSCPGCTGADPSTTSSRRTDSSPVPGKVTSEPSYICSLENAISRSSSER